MKTAVVLFNLGGPDKQESVRPFLFNLFNDPNIFKLPNPFRFLLAKLISTLRTKEATEIYSEIGGKSPILDITKDQAAALEGALAAQGIPSKVFVCMRYWHPMTAEVVKEVKDYNPDNIFLLPLYPQYSTTTTKSSLDLWFKEAKKQNLSAPTKYTCCYPMDKKFVESHQRLIQKKIDHIKDKKIRILFSAHSLPVSIIKGGDPYQWQVEQTVSAVMTGLKGHDDHVLAYQSKVTPVKWLEPSTPSEIEKAIKEDAAIIIVPIAFVSDHSETLVELDIEYKEMADDMGYKHYFRSESLNIDSVFIDSLAEIVIKSDQTSNVNIAEKICPTTFKRCYQQI